jgi:hypothetical protein
MKKYSEFGKQLKLGLADLLGAELIEYDSTFAFTRGGHQIRIEVYGYAEGERRIGFRIICGLEVPASLVKIWTKSVGLLFTP